MPISLACGDTLEERGGFKEVKLGIYIYHAMMKGTYSHISTFKKHCSMINMMSKWEMR